MRYRTLRVELRGPLLVGGHSAPVAEADAGTARDRMGQILIPGSSVKGALRQAVRELVLAEDGRACDAPWEPCRDEPCAVCRVFGLSGPDRPMIKTRQGGKVEPGGIRVSDAVLQSGGRDGLAVRNGVAIDRWTGAAAPGRLYRREVFEARESATFEARLEASVDGDSWRLLERAIPLVEGIGNSQSRGYGEVVRISLSDAQQPEPHVTVSSPDRERLIVTLTADEPLCLGSLPDPGFYRATERSVTGGTLLGAITRAASSAGIIDGDRIEGLRFSDLHPGLGGDRLSLPMPRCAMRCRKCKRNFDRSIHEALGRHLAREGMGQPTPASCASCGGVLKPVAGWLGGTDPQTRVVTRLARDPVTRSAAPGHLHAREQIEAGSVFVGTCVAEGAGRALLEALADRGVPVRVGGLRSRGLGTVKLRIRGTGTDLSRRLDEFRERASGLLHGIDLPRDPAALILVVCRTDLAAGMGDVLGACGAGARLFASWARPCLRSGWNGSAGTPSTVRQVVAAGSCWLVEAPSVDQSQLSAAETEGIGQDRVLGLGRLHFSPRIEG